MAGALRLRVFAGPNGSGKTTIINDVRKARVNGRGIDFGLYINADDIARALPKGVDLRPFDVPLNEARFKAFAAHSGLLGNGLSRFRLRKSLVWYPDRVRSRRRAPLDRIAQLLAQYLYHELLKAKRKFTLETVFSHPGKLSLMKQAKEDGYKVYLYFVSTADPAINVERVKEVRVKEGGHDVPKDKIIRRYHRTMANLNAAMNLAYHAFLWDNSNFGSSSLFCEMKRTDGGVKWDIDADQVPVWFVEHFLRHHPDDPTLSRVHQAVLKRLSKD